MFTPGRYVLDGEIVITGEAGGEEFGLLQQRLHPAASRVDRLSREIPAGFAPFDLLAHDDASLLEAPFAERRARLEEDAGGYDPGGTLPSTPNARASGWPRRRASSPSASTRPTGPASGRA